MQFARITAPHVYRTQNVPAWWYRVYLFKYIRQLLLYTLCEFKPRAVSTPNRASASHWGPPIAGTPSSPRHPIVRRELARPASSDSRRRYFIIRKRTFSFITLTGFFFFFLLLPDEFLRIARKRAVNCRFFVCNYFGKRVAVASTISPSPRIFFPCRNRRRYLAFAASTRSCRCPGQPQSSDGFILSSIVIGLRSCYRRTLFISK